MKQQFIIAALEGVLSKAETGGSVDAARTNTKD